jgi:hypothetical protein
MAAGTRRKWVGELVILVVLLWISAVPGHTDRGGRGYGGMGIQAMGIEGRASSSARALSSPSENTGGHTGSLMAIHLW